MESPVLVPAPAVKDKPVVIYSRNYGKDKQFYLAVVVLPGGDVAQIQFHRDKWEGLVVDPKTRELDLPGNAAFGMDAPPEGYLLMGFKGVISAWKKKV